MSDYFERIERQLVRRVEAGAPRRLLWPPRAGLVAPALSLAVVVAIAAVFVHVRGHSSPQSPARGASELVFRAQATTQTPVVTSAAIARTVAVMRQRAAAYGISGASIHRTAANQITVQLPGSANLAEAERKLATTARLEFYDWEANALTPNGETVASELQKQDPSAIKISEGSGSAAAGDPGAGSMVLYDAVKLASKQPAQISSDDSRVGSEYYAFGAPGSAACATAARTAGKTPTTGVHCLLAGPEDNRRDLLLGLPAGVSASEVQQLVIPPGTVVLQAADPDANQHTNFKDPNAQFYVLKDHVSLFGNETTNPQQSTDQGGNPDVTFGFNSNGASAFQQVTQTIARRGQLISGLGQPFNQHFAVALDTKLITVPQIDFKSYPDGITGANGADITGGFTTQSAHELATQLRLGALPINLHLILAKPPSGRG